MRKARHFSKVFDSFIMSLSIFRGQILHLNLWICGFYNFFRNMVDS